MNIKKKYSKLALKIKRSSVLFSINQQEGSGIVNYLCAAPCCLVVQGWKYYIILTHCGIYHIRILRYTKFIQNRITAVMARPSEVQDVEDQPMIDAPPHDSDAPSATDVDQSIEYTLRTVSILIKVSVSID
jgi:hypothetical protein